jgi:hypothetical protein
LEILFGHNFLRKFYKGHIGVNTDYGRIKFNYQTGDIIYISNPRPADKKMCFFCQQCLSSLSSSLVYRFWFQSTEKNDDMYIRPYISGLCNNEKKNFNRGIRSHVVIQNVNLICWRILSYDTYSPIQSLQLHRCFGLMHLNRTQHTEEYIHDSEWYKWFTKYNVKLIPVLKYYYIIQ